MMDKVMLLVGAVMMATVSHFYNEPSYFAAGSVLWFMGWAKIAGEK